MQLINRCINIDWLEMYCLEYGEPHTADYYRRCGYFVKEREYGTKHMAEVFTLHDKMGDPFLEVRRAPRPATSGHHTVYPDNACTLRFVNRYCYFDQCARIMREFIERHNLEDRRIFRLDLALDFVKFDSGDKPADFLRRYVHHKYAKVYQSMRTLHGEDRWDGAVDNSISWGNKNSMVVTRFYNKSREIREVKDKPWIRQAWFESGIIDDPTLLTCDGKDAEVWRLEFQINSSARQWLRLDGDKGHEYVEHNLECYYFREQMLLAFANLVEHYFQFRKYKRGVRKYDCKPKILFLFNEINEHYSLSNVAVNSVTERNPLLRISTLNRIREEVLHRPDLVRSSDELITYYREHDQVSRTMYGTSPQELQLRMKIADDLRRKNQAMIAVSVDTARDSVTSIPLDFAENPENTDV